MRIGSNKSILWYEDLGSAVWSTACWKSGVLICKAVVHRNCWVKTEDWTNQQINSYTLQGFNRCTLVDEVSEFDERFHTLITWLLVLHFKRLGT